MNFSLSERDNQRAVVVAQFHIPCLNAKLYIPLRNHYSDLQPLLNLIMLHSSISRLVFKNNAIFITKSLSNLKTIFVIYFKCLQLKPMTPERVNMD